LKDFYVSMPASGGYCPVEEAPAGETGRRPRFAVVDTVFGSGNLGQSGYSMLFERRGDRWVFLFIVRGWIS
jgi:hypothetical protein